MPEQSDAGLAVAAEPLRGLVADWDALAARVDASVFLDPGWFARWFDAFGGGDQEILAARRGGQLVGVLPLMRSRSGLVSMTNWHSPQYGPMAQDAEAEQQLIGAALARAASRARLDLSFLPEDDSVVTRLTAAAQRSGFRTIVRTIERSPFVDLDGDWESFEERLPGKRRSDLRRRRRRLAEQGTCRFDCEDGPERLSETLAEGLMVEEAGLDGRHGTPILARADTHDFYRGIAEWASERGYLRLFFLRLDGQAIAFAFCIADGKSLCVLKVGFHPHHARLAPGLLLTREMLAHAFESGYETYEFLGQIEPYKMIWTNQVRYRVRVQAFASSTAGLGSYLAWKRVRPIARWAMRAGRSSRGAR